MRKAAVVMVILCGAMDAHAQDTGRQVRYAPLSDTLPKMHLVFMKDSKLPTVKYNYYQSLGTACKAELKLEQATKVPFRFRLGSLQQTDYLEQKPNTQKP